VILTLVDLLIAGKTSLVEFLLIFYKLLRFSLFLFSRYADLFYVILSNDDSNLFLGSLSFILLKSLFLGGSIF